MFIQINLHHSKAVAALLCQEIAIGDTNIALTQEPHAIRGQIRG
jgi:hypothetical protein